MKNKTIPDNLLEVTQADEWSTLQASTRQAVIAAARDYSAEHSIFVKSRIGMGRSLAIIQQHLSPVRLWQRFLDANNLSKTNAVRWIAEYETGSKKVPQQILDAAIDQGLDSLRQDAVLSLTKTLSTAKTPEQVKRAALELVSAHREHKRKGRGKGVKQPEDVVEKIVEFTVRMLGRLPEDLRQGAWIEVKSQIDPHFRIVARAKAA